jgi:hypothetical protein
MAGFLVLNGYQAKLPPMEERLAGSHLFGSVRALVRIMV